MFYSSAKEGLRLLQYKEIAVLKTSNFKQSSTEDLLINPCPAE